MIVYDRKKFFDGLRKFAGGRLSENQVKGAEAILNEWESRHPHGDTRQLAYILATAWHETGGRLEPVRETFAKSDAEAIRRLRNRRYARVDPSTGKAYFGRGFVQLTWKRNYERMSKIVGKDLVNNPDLVLDLETSSVVLIEGMLRGLFTGKALGDYVNHVKKDYVNARRVVNGLDRAKKIAKYAKKFEKILFKAKTEKASEPKLEDKKNILVVLIEKLIEILTKVFKYGKIK